MTARPRPLAPWPAGGREAGQATAELALLMPAVVLLLTAVLSAGVAAVAQARCVDAAWAAARLAARSEPSAVVLAAARARAPRAAVVNVRSTAVTTSVTVTAPVRLPLPGAPRLVLRARSVAARELP